MRTYLTQTAVVVALAVWTVGPAAPQSPDVEIEGTYDMELVAEGMGRTPLTLVVSGEAGELQVESSGSPDLTVSGIVVEEDDEGIAVTLAAAWQGMPFDLPGRLTGTEMGGTWANGFVGGTWSATLRVEEAE